MMRSNIVSRWAEPLLNGLPLSKVWKENTFFNFVSLHLLGNHILTLRLDQRTDVLKLGLHHSQATWDRLSDYISVSE